MKTNAVFSRTGNRATERGGVLITAMIFAFIIGMILVGYVKLSTNSFKMAHRTFYADAANNLAEAGTEEAVWSFNKLGASSSASAISAAWSGWTLGNTVADANVDTAGDGYTSTPTVTISGGGGTGATAVATLATSYKTEGGVEVPHVQIGSVTITNHGTGYTSAPTVTLNGGGASEVAHVSARLAASRTVTFPASVDNGNATGVVKVWVAGYDGTSAIPMVVAKASLTPVDGAPIVKIVKVLLNKNGVLPKGVVALGTPGINWNGHPSSNSFISSTTPGYPPFSPYNIGTSRANTILASLTGDIDLSHGTVSGTVMTGPGVTVTGGTITGSTIPNFSFPAVSWTPPTNATNPGVSVGNAIPATLPRQADIDARVAAIAAHTTTLTLTDPYYYYAANATIGAVSISAGQNVVLTGTNTSMDGGLMVQPTSSGIKCGKCTVYIDGPVAIGNSPVNTTSWAGALDVYTTTSQDCVVSGNGAFYGCLTAPNSQLRCNGGGNDDIDLCGAFVMNSIVNNGHMKIHFDEGLGTTPAAKTWSLALWTELQSATDRQLYEPQFSSF